MRKIYYLYAVSFLAAFLLFQIELIISKAFLPNYGGSYLVWAACVVFFQCALLAGYGYSHLLVKSVGISRYNLLHLILICMPILTFSAERILHIHPGTDTPLVIDIFFKLASTIGLAFFALSTVSIISQSWLAATDLPEHANPYALYAVSNAGSFLALFTYPFFFEPAFDLKEQLVIWRIAYFLFAAIYLIAFRLIKCSEPPAKRKIVFDLSVLFRRFEVTQGLIDAVYWFLLSAASSMLFLSVTNIFTYEAAPCPLLWIIPLGIYLATFTLAFKQKAWPAGWINRNKYIILGFSAALFFLSQARYFPVLFFALAYFLSLFAICMLCQSRLYASRPKSNGGLTGFYVTIATGGVVGSMIVTWVAPVLFERAPSEYLLGLFIIPLALAVKEGRPGFKIGDLRWAAYILLILILYPAVFKAYNIFGLILLFLALKAAFNRLGHKHLLTCLCIFSLMIFSTLPLNGWEMDGKDIFASRNYYGIYRLTAFNDLLALHNGTTLHGSQFIIGDEKKEGEPTSYYHRSTPAGALLQEEAFNFKRIGIVGLGAGTLAAYAKTGQEIDFFELDNDVYDIADLFFTYLKRSPAKISYIFGDARVQLRNKPADLYDLLIVDAFSGDSVPVHLLTLEAIEEYRRHLKADGIILFHISNRYLDLAPVLYSNARALNAYINLGDNPKKDYAMMRSIWVAFSWDGKRNELILSKFEWEKNVPSAGDGKFKPWTDLYSNIASVFKFELLLEQVKNFKLFYW